MGDICKLCGGDKDHPKKIKSYVKGGRRVGVFNGDLATGCYVDINGNFIGPDGYARDDEGKIMEDENGIPILGTTPSYIDIEDYEYEGKPFTSIYETKLRANGVPILSNRTDDGIIIIDYFRLFDIRLTVPDQWLTDEQLMGRDAFYKLWKNNSLYGGGSRQYNPFQHYMNKHKTVEAFWVETYSEGGM